jgi:hypothetical protein
MKLIRTTTWVAAALSLVVFAAGSAEAQVTPTLNVTNNNGSVTIEWTAIPGAQGYNLRAGSSSGATNIANVTVPAIITRIVVAAPAGRYFLSVRAVAGNQLGPWSNEVDITIGGSQPPPNPGPCNPPARPNVTTRVTGGTVSVSWDNIPGASYQVQYSRYSGQTELVQNTNQNSHSQYVGMVGTFFVRVVAGNACGSTTSNEASFTIENLNSGGGPRTPDPPAGQLIPRATLGYLSTIVTQAANQYRGDLLNSCTETGGNHNFMFRVVQALRQIDSRWGLNYKRGWPGDLSHDIVTYNPTNRPDNGESQVYLFDIIGGHCGGNPGPNWADVTDATWSARGNPACGSEWCARWTLDPYLRAGFPADPREQQ